MGEAVGVVGIGLVGTAICRRLLHAGMPVVGCDVAPGRLEALRALGGRSAASPAEVAAACERVVLCLLTRDIGRRVVGGPDGLLAAPRPPRLVIDTTTGAPAEAESLARELERAGTAYLEAAPVGSSRQIAAGEAVLLTGGTPQARAAAADILDALAPRTFHLGPAGAGSRAKLAVNLVLGLHRLVLAEGLVFAGGVGLEPAMALELFRATPAYSRAMDTKGPRMLAADFAPEARLAQHRKDVGLILQLAEDAGLDLPLSALHASLLDAAIAAGDGDLDNSAIIRTLRRPRAGN